MTSRFIDVDVAASEHFADDVALRFKAIAEPAALVWVEYDAGHGVRRFTVAPDQKETVQVVLVEDSSDGEACLIFAGDEGLALVDAHGAIVREPYLLLARATRHG